MRGSSLFCSLVCVVLLLGAPAAWGAGASSHFDLGLASARQGDPQAALASYERAARLDRDLPGLQLALGTTYYELGRDNEATGALRRAIADDPRDASAHFLLGLVARRAGRSDEARRHFELAARLDPEFSDYVVLARRRPNAREGKPWHVSGSLGLEASDNVAVPELDANSGASDVAGIVEFGGGYRFLDEPGYQAEVSYDFYQSLYEDFDSADLQAHSLGLEGRRSFEAIDLDVEWRFDASSRDGDRVVDVHTLAPTLGYSWGPRAYTSLGYRFLDKNFAAGAQAERDALTHVASIEHFVFLGEGESNVSVGYSFEREATVSSIFDYNGHAAGARYKSFFELFGQEFEAELGYRFQVRSYESGLSAGTDPRRDDRHNFVMAVEKTFADIATLRLAYDHFHSNSNLETADYSENTFGMSIGSEF
jgi:tetratricopeptide (TPR) repeat protein